MEVLLVNYVKKILNYYLLFTEYNRFFSKDPNMELNLQHIRPRRFCTANIVHNPSVVSGHEHARYRDNKFI